MSSFSCAKCQAVCTDTDFGYVTGCDHHPVDAGARDRYLRQQLCDLYDHVNRLVFVATESQSHLTEPLKRWREEIETGIGVMLGGK